MNNVDQWWKAEKGRVHARVLDAVQAIEREEFNRFDSFVKLAALYDPNGIAGLGMGSTESATGFITENVIASNVDTVTAAIATSDVRARFMTDDGDWETQRTARRLEWYAEGLSKLHDVDAKCALAFGQGAAVRGTGVIYVDIVDGELAVEHVLADDIVVDERECRSGGMPKQMHRRKLVDKDDLIAKYPQHEEAITRAVSARGGMSTWAGYRPVEDNQVVVVYSWIRPLGNRKGRYTVCIEGRDLEDKPWDEEGFPFAKIVWSERVGGWYGIGLAERIKGHQRVLNKANWQIDRIVDQNAVQTMYVRQADAKLAVQSINRLGQISVIKGDPPVSPVLPAVHPEMYRRQETVKASASQESGVSQMAQHGTKPAGLDSGVALREYRDQTTQRFATQEKAYERLKLDVILLMLGCCKKLGKKAPIIMRRTRFGTNKIPWAKVDMGDVKVQIAAAANLSRTPAGRTQLVLELAQAGVISQDSARRLISHPDAERELSLYTAAIENIERCFDEIADGNVVMPEPYTNLKLAVWRGQQQYLIWRDDGAPESVLEDLRQFIVVAADQIAPPEAAPVANDNGMQPPVAANENAGPAPMPTEAPPQAALAAQAMNLRAV